MCRGRITLDLCTCRGRITLDLCMCRGRITLDLCMCRGRITLDLMHLHGRITLQEEDDSGSLCTCRWRTTIDLMHLQGEGVILDIPMKENNGLSDPTSGYQNPIVSPYTPLFVSNVTSEFSRVSKIMPEFWGVGQWFSSKLTKLLSRPHVSRVTVALHGKTKGNFKPFTLSNIGTFN